MTRSRALVAIASAILLPAVSGLLAAPAQATPPEYYIVPGTPAQVWHQSFQRASADAPCVPPAALDIPWQESWDPAENVWTASWEQWPNGGTGGWTCTRSITWAPGTPAVIFVLR